jgi:hypothetical protein
MVAAVVLVDAQLGALHLSRLFDGADRPSARRLHQWEVRIRVWAHRYPGEVRRFAPEVGRRRTRYDLVELQARAEAMLDLLDVAA